MLLFLYLMGGTACASRTGMRGNWIGSSSESSAGDSCRNVSGSSPSDVASGTGGCALGGGVGFFVATVFFWGSGACLGGGVALGSSFGVSLAAFAAIFAVAFCSF